MTHPERDQDLLLLAHRALPPLKAVLTRWHLSRCPDCRQRLGQLQAATHGLAGAIRGRQLPLWSLPAAGAFSGGVVVWLLVVTVLVVALLGTLTVRQNQLHSAYRLSPISSTPCRPDLPSDRCR